MKTIATIIMFSFSVCAYGASQPAKKQNTYIPIRGKPVVIQQVAKPKPAPIVTRGMAIGSAPAKAPCVWTPVPAGVKGHYRNRAMTQNK